jgi:sulfur relay (sulfurtransferase) DsrC/TusE family protein
MRTDGRTDITKLIVAFRDFVNEPKKRYFCAIVHRNYGSDKGKRNMIVTLLERTKSEGNCRIAGVPFGSRLTGLWN